MPTAAERLIWGQGDQTTIGVVDADLRGPDDCVESAKLAATICWEKCVGPHADRAEHTATCHCCGLTCTRRAASFTAPQR